MVEGVVAIDGKTLRGSGNKGGNALLHGDGLRGAKRPVPGAGRHLRQGARVDGVKSLLDILILKGCIVTMDAPGSVDRAGRAYRRPWRRLPLLQVEDNQKNLAEAIREFLEQRRQGRLW
ncbi:MAG: hypothetical protein IPI02_22885 [Sterolibacteriaceae bacterium]|nr:hypothetical protein [Sterolibacteriaceae bacterium]